MLLVAAAGCKGPLQQNLPPSERLLEPGPGVGGPGPGVMMFQPPMCAPPQTSQVAFGSPEGMTVTWDIGFPGAFDSQPLVVPGRYNFPQGAIYRLKLTAIPSRPGVELYPTVEVAPTLARTAAFLNHNAIPVQFTEEDFDQVLSGNFVTKVIYLPDPEFQELALAGVETLVSTRLDPGIDPIVEANRRGAILAIVRIGNKDLQTPTPGSAMNGMPGVVPASFNQEGGPVMGMTGAPLPCPLGMPTCVGPGCNSGVPPSNYIAGVTGPQYGMPYCGTPIGLVGPPHVPLGIPAGLEQHTMVNHTCVNLPEPEHRERIDVKQRPGINYPQPVNHVRIVEETHTGLGFAHQPYEDKHQVYRPGPEATGGGCPVPAGEACPPGAGAPCPPGAGAAYPPGAGAAYPPGAGAAYPPGNG